MGRLNALAVLYGLQKMHTYIYGRHVTVATDHKPLFRVCLPNRHSRFDWRELHWELKTMPLTSYMNQGLGILLMDCPDCQWPLQELKKSLWRSMWNWSKRTVHCYPLRRHVQEAGKKDTELQQVEIAVKEGWNESDESWRQWKPLNDELAYCGVVVVSWVPAPLREKALKLAH